MYLHIWVRIQFSILFDVIQLIHIQYLNVLHIYFIYICVFLCVPVYMCLCDVWSEQITFAWKLFAIPFPLLSIYIESVCGGDCFLWFQFISGSNISFPLITRLLTITCTLMRWPIRIQYEYCRLPSTPKWRNYLNEKMRKEKWFIVEFVGQRITERRKMNEIKRKMLCK